MNNAFANVVHLLDIEDDLLQAASLSHFLSMQYRMKRGQSVTSKLVTNN